MTPFFFIFIFFWLFGKGYFPVFIVALWQRILPVVSLYIRGLFVESTPCLIFGVSFIKIISGRGIICGSGINCGPVQTSKQVARKNY